MSPSLLLALRPPAELAERVGAFRQRFGVQDAAAVPHITVKARSGLGTVTEVGAVAQVVAAQTKPFPVEIGAPCLFPNGSALYLQVSSPGAIALHLALLEALAPDDRFGYEGPGMKPHLTLALSRRGLDLGALSGAAAAEFSDLTAQPFSFIASELTLMQKPGPGGIYSPLAAWPLQG